MGYPLTIHKLLQYQLVNRKVPVPPTCDICTHEPETLQHLFKDCSLTVQAWQLCPFPLHNPHSTPLSCSDWVATQILLLHSEDGLHSPNLKQFIWTLWSIWLHRNERIFRQIDPDVSRITHQIRDLMDLDTHLSSLPCFNNLRFLHPPESSLRSPPGFLGVHLGTSQGFSPQCLIAFDAAWQKDTGVMGGAWTLHRPAVPLQAIATGGGRYGLATSALHAECQTLLHALKWARHNHLTSTTFLTDCSNLITALQSPMATPSTILWTINAIKEIATTFPWCFILKVNRQQVQAAHDVAQLCARTCSQFTTAYLDFH